MPAFRFRLERVLEWSREKYEIEEHRLAACIAAVDEIKQRAACFQAERESIDREMLSRPSQYARELVALGLYRLRATKLASELQQERVVREAAVDEQRAKVQAARLRV